MSFIRILIALSLIVVSAYASAADDTLPFVDDTKYAQILSEGVHLAASGNQSEAISKYDQIISAYEDAYRGKRVKIYCARWQTETLMYLLEAASAKKSEKAVVLSVNWANAYHMKAYSLVELNRISEAKEMLNQAITLSPQNSNFLAELGYIYQREKNWPKALKTFQAAASAARDFSPPEVKNTELSRAWRGMGFVYVEQHKLDEAERMYRQCLELDASDRIAAAELQYVQALRAKGSSQGTSVTGP